MLALVLISIALWVVMIGLIKLTGRCNFAILRDNATLNRFFSLHYLLPFILLALVWMHLMALHQDGSNNPEGIASTSDRIRFHPYYTTKDLVGLFWMAIV